MLIGLILFVLVVLGLILAFAAYVVFWTIMIVFWVSAVVLGFLVGDPYIGFFLAFPVSGLIFWLINLSSQKSSDSNSP